MAVDAPFAFFSYARNDSQFALRLAKELRSAGVSVWLDQLAIRPGQRWDKAVEDALRNCPRMVVILSPASVASTHVLDEVNFALEKRKIVIPVLHRECEIPFRLLRVQYVDFRAEYATGVRELLKVISRATTAVPSSEPHPQQRPEPLPTRYCSECGKPWPREQLARIGGRPVCPNCQPGPALKPRAAGGCDAGLAVAGFWVRFVAALLDCVMLVLAFVVLPKNGYLAAIAFVVYESVFVSRFGATPGKMALKLKVVRSDGGPLSPGRAVGRCFAKIVSGTIFGMGYIMAGIDARKRALHDRLCDTCVIQNVRPL